MTKQPENCHPTNAWETTYKVWMTNQKEIKTMTQKEAEQISEWLGDSISDLRFVNKKSMIKKTKVMKTVIADVRRRLTYIERKITPKT